jgi:hypothetical protein
LRARSWALRASVVQSVEQKRGGARGRS